MFVFFITIVMAHIITFTTSKFDVSKETPNPINPIAGESALLWLRDELAKAGYSSTEPDTEDWGWYMDVRGAGSTYLVGASADAEEITQDVEWTVQIHKSRSFKERLFGQNKMSVEDPLSEQIQRIVREDDDVEDVLVDTED